MARLKPRPFKSTTFYGSLFRWNSLDGAKALEKWAACVATKVAPFQGEDFQDSLLLADEGLPEFDAVAFGVGDPGESAVVGVFAFGVDGDACSGELGEEGIEVVDAVIDHGLLRASFVAVAEVGGVV